MIPYKSFMNRMEIMEKTGCSTYEIIFDTDRTETGFDSKTLFNSINKLSISDQRKLQLGMQWINSFDGKHPVIIGNFAYANFTNSPVELTPMIDYVIDNFEKFAEFIKGELEKKNNSIKTLSEYIEIEDYGCRIFSRKLNDVFEDSRSHAKAVKVFGSNVLISPTILRW